MSSAVSESVPAGSYETFLATRLHPWAVSAIARSANHRLSDFRTPALSTGASDNKLREGYRCERRESNPEGFPHRILSPARLPVPPRSRGVKYSGGFRGGEKREKGTGNGEEGATFTLIDRPDRRTATPTIHSQ